ncbi:SH3 domain-containing protein [Ideonella sp. A 288]|uniref:SH3 domain-containing protein n=1 Tax=Ideonella sp. A 288 TaxID=1962181 RepID=UPI000B4AE6D6|nr:SH3 domain-containing protein [Ideonella sp. A 288]
MTSTVFPLGLVLCALALPAQAADAADPTAEPTTEALQVADAFLEMRTGPGRGYPVFHVAQRGEAVVVLLRHTDWFKVRSARGAEGWVERAQLQGTLTAAGSPKTFRDLLVDDYLARRVEMGAAWGRFKSEPMLKLWGAVRLGESLGVELSVGQVQGLFSGTDFWHVNAVAEPWSDKRLSPYLSVGVGSFSNLPNQSLVGAVDTRAKLANAGLGLRWYVTERFVARTDWTLYTAFVSDQRSREFRALTLGLSFFF